MEFLELIETKQVAIFDGALGTELERRGSPAGALTNLSNPDIVLEVQCEYVKAGCDAFVTNTFCMNRIYMETHGANADIEEVNRKGVEIANRAAGGKSCVLGEIGLAGQMLEPYGFFKENQFYKAYLQQAQIIDAAGVDAFIVETATDIREALCAVKVCRENFSLPVIISMAYTTEKNGGVTMMGNKAADCAQALEEAGADVIGINCGDFDPRNCAIIVETCHKACSLPILAQPNAGKPRLEGATTVYDISPEEFAKEIANPCIQAGAAIIGGCCGTTPRHIKAIVDMINEF